MSANKTMSANKKSATGESYVFDHKRMLSNMRNALSAIDVDFTSTECENDKGLYYKVNLFREFGTNQPHHQPFIWFKMDTSTIPKSFIYGRLRINTFYADWIQYLLNEQKWNEKFPFQYEVTEQEHGNHMVSEITFQTKYDECKPSVAFEQVLSFVKAISKIIFKIAKQDIPIEEYFAETEAKATEAKETEEPVNATKETKEPTIATKETKEPTIATKETKEPTIATKETKTKWCDAPIDVPKNVPTTTPTTTVSLQNEPEEIYSSFYKDEENKHVVSKEGVPIGQLTLDREKAEINLLKCQIAEMQQYVQWKISEMEKNQKIFSHFYPN
jgi:hypothetical protein